MCRDHRQPHGDERPLRSPPINHNTPGALAPLAVASLARIVHETHKRDRGDGRATGQPSRGIAGLGPEPYFISTSHGELVLSLSKEHPRTPRVRLRKTGRSRRQGHLRNKAHPEPLRSPRCKAGLPDFVSHPAARQGLTAILSMTRLCAFVEQITLPRAIRSRLEAAPTGFLLVEPTARSEGRPYPRSQQVVRA